MSNSIVFNKQPPERISVELGPRKHLYQLKYLLQIWVQYNMRKKVIDA